MRENSMLIDEICALLLPRAANRSIVDVRIGLGYTAVQLDDGRCGLAYTFRDDVPEGCSVVEEAGSLTGRPAGELCEWTRSLDLLASAVGLATLNALVEPPRHAVGTDLIELLAAGPDDVVGMVGYFGPLIAPLRKRAKTLHVFERRAHSEPGILPDWAAQTIFPGCTIVILSATALLNRTLDGLLEKCGSAREVVVLGPSTPLIPEAFALHGVTLLSGIQVMDPRHLLRIVSEGGGTRRFGQSVRKLSVRPDGDSRGNQAPGA
jgi:uncharacterized protein (DUF4213/DUF364 family)